MKMIRLVLAVLAICFLGALSASAHMDTIIELEDGKLVGLPEEYQPAEFDIEKGALRLGPRVFQFSEYLRSLFPKDGRYKLSFSSSWYHSDYVDMPSYLAIDIRPRGKDFHYHLLIDMDKAELMYLNVVLQLDKNTTRDMRIDLKSGQGGVTRRVN